jgi:superfamily II DNA or RNA helicase
MLKNENQTAHEVSALLSEAAGCLTAFLETILPNLHSDWWKTLVIPSLSYAQQRRAEQYNLKAVADFDLAALLRIFDKNWFEIARLKNIPNEARHYLKEMSTVRNNWAHARPGGPNTDDMYRDIDTLERFLKVIFADEEKIERVKSVKKSLLAQSVENSQTQPAPGNNQTQEFQIGSLVQLKSNPEIKGAVIAVAKGEHGSKYTVFHDNATHDYYSSQITLANTSHKTEQTLSCDQFHAHISALQIQNPSVSNLYSLRSAKIDFIPYQFRPVLKFIKSDRPRLLIADEVGVGKTVEAALIFKELQARKEVRSVLIICPRPLVTERKWAREMKRFGENFTHLDGPLLRTCIMETNADGCWPQQHQKTIIPYSLFDSEMLSGSAGQGSKPPRKGLYSLDPPPRFDLVIVDEAHHIRNPETAAYKGVRYFCEHAEAVVFLTATPLQLGTDDLFVLLNAIRPDLVIDKESFNRMAEPNPYINRAIAHIRAQELGWGGKAQDELVRAANTQWGQALLKGNPDFIRVINELQREPIDQQSRVRLISDTEQLHTFSGIINRTRRRDIANFTIRKPETVHVPFTNEQREIHDSLLAIQAKIFTKLHPGTNVKFMMTTLRRQSASCLHALVPLIEDILGRNFSFDSEDYSDSLDTEPGSLASDKQFTEVKSEIIALLNLAKNLSKEDPKLERLESVIRQKQSLANNKVMLFSSFRHTLAYLHSHLSKAGFRVGLIHGDVADEERVHTRSRFERKKDDPEALDLLLFSEVGCEGLDYQFCDCMINYDLPWNPMRIEQRIGRIDRNGQKSPTVAIINFITPDTVDADIYDRCLSRIGVFERAIGASEEILGEITEQLTKIAENYKLSPAERQAQLQQLADNEIRLMQINEEMEQKQREFFGIQIPTDAFAQEVDDATSYWLTPTSLCRLTSHYLQGILATDAKIEASGVNSIAVRVNNEVRHRLLSDFEKLPKHNNAAYQEWEDWLKSGEQKLRVSFNAEKTSDKQEIFANATHPFVKQAAKHINYTSGVSVFLSVTTDVVPPGNYHFSIYHWRLKGMREDLILQPVSNSNQLTPHLNKLLTDASDAGANTNPRLDLVVMESLEKEHYALWNSACVKHKDEMIQIAKFRKQSLSTSHKARISQLSEQLTSSSNEKIRVMKQSQLASAEADFARRMQEIEIAIEKTDILTQKIAAGIIQVRGLHHANKL